MNLKPDDSKKHRDPDGEYSLEELIADFAGRKGTGEIIPDEEGVDTIADLGIALDEDDTDVKEIVIPTEEIDADATGEYSRIINEYAASGENGDSGDIEESAEKVVDIPDEDIVDIVESTREYMIEDIEGASEVDNTGVIAGIDGMEEVPTPAEALDITEQDEDDAPTPIGAFMTPDSADTDADDDIPDLADLRKSIAEDGESEEDDIENHTGSDLYEKLELGPVLDGLHMDELDGDTIDIPGFDPSDPLGMFGGDEPAPERRSQSVQGDDEAPVEDFLGLGAIRTGVRKGAAAEVLFDGVSMSFDDQIRKVTLAEILLAQGRRGEAADLYEEVADRGATFWVDKRVEELLGRG